tara:strand:+ start:251 stop:640 length:390 start_codon:yes stop_codon:yes gene_type:complete
MKTKNVKTGSDRSFGILFTIIFLIIGLWPLLNNENIKFLPLIISVIFLLLTVNKSKILTPLNKVWLKFGLILGKFFTPIVLGLIFFITVLPTGIIMRIIGKDILSLKKNKLKTYWINKVKTQSTMKDQF